MFVTQSVLCVRVGKRVGERTAESMVSYLNKETGNDVRIVRPLEATTTLDDDNFQSIALDPTKDVLVRPPATPASSSTASRSHIALIAPPMTGAPPFRNQRVRIRC